MNEISIVYHADCMDGHAAAWITRRALGADARYVPWSYDRPAPEPGRFAGHQLYIVDFSFPRDVTKRLCEEASTVDVIDHHASAIEQLEGLVIPNLHLYLDSNFSGAHLAWRYFNSAGIRPPELVRYVEDRDLWKFELPFCREVHEALLLYPLAAWDELEHTPISKLIGEGGPILAYKQKMIERAIRTPFLKHFKHLERVPTVNVPHDWASDACNLMIESMPTLMAASYCDVKGGREFSLRSKNPDGPDVSKIAMKYGGGGHRHAAGFIMPFHELENAGLL